MHRAGLSASAGLLVRGHDGVPLGIGYRRQGSKN